MVGDQFVERVELNNPQEIFAIIISQNLEVLNIGARWAICPETM
jgi:hypothetical protein